MLPFRSSSFSCSDTVALVVVAAMAVHGAACVADEPATSIRENEQQKPAALQPAQNPAPAEASQTPAAAETAVAAVRNVEDSGFPLPIWRTARFDDVNNLAGVLLRTEVGTVQIKQLQWGVDKEGSIYICSVAGYTREGESVVLGSPEGCVAPASKEGFLGTAMTRSDTFVQSFDFATDYEGYLALVDVTFEAQSTERSGSDCSVPVIFCVSEGCSGVCGIVVPEVAIGRSGSELGKPLLVLADPVECTCTGASGHCEPRIMFICKGECPAQQVCTTTWGYTCECQ